MEFYEQLIGGYDFCWAINNGWGVKLMVELCQVPSMDLSKIKIAGGDFVQKQLQQELNKEATIQRVCLITQTKMEGPTVLFTASVSKAKACAHYLSNNYGVPAVCVYGTQPEEEREESLRKFKTGEAKVLCNCAVVAVGFDFPPTQTLIMARPTRSLSFALQCWGRALRPLSGVVDFPRSTAILRKEAIANSDKPYAKIVDCTPASQEHTLITGVDMFARFDNKEVKERVLKQAAGSDKPLSQEEIAALAEEEATKIAKAKQLEAMRRATEGAASGRVVGRDIDVVFKGKRSVGTYMNPLRGKYAGKRLSEIPISYLHWGQKNVGTPWIRSLYSKEIRRRNERNT